MQKQYVINEIYLSIQGEGMRTGHPSIFMRFTGCNMRCDLHANDKSPGGFACDTEFESGRKMTAEEIIEELNTIKGDCNWIVMTGGEPGLQVDSNLLQKLGAAGFMLAVETNGSVALPDGFDWITVSPKVAEHAIKQRTANEVKYVRGYGQALPKTVVESQHYLISPAFSGLEMDARTLAWCQKLVSEDDTWKLSLQTHKMENWR
jgi:7-carboxy-7-deazaguanine synthase